MITTYKIARVTDIVYKNRAKLNVRETGKGTQIKFK